MSGWESLCEDCWLDKNPTEYLPYPAAEYDACERCGEQDTLIYGYRPSPPVCDVHAAIEPKEAI